MKYNISSNQLQVPYGMADPGHEKILASTLALYDKGGNLSNSPLIKTQLNKWHKDCYKLKGQELQSGLLKRQDAFISLYESFKKDGYTGSTMLVYFDDEGRVHLYDGYHRLSIMNHLGIKATVSCETQWTGIDNSVGKDFPLAEVLAAEHPFGEWLYQPITDERVKNWKLARNDCPQRLKHIANSIVGKRILDIGCAEGYFSRELAKMGYDVTAIDMRAGFINSARYLSVLDNTNVDYRQVDDWKAFIEQNGPYDTVLFLCVIHNDMKVIGVEEGLKKMEAFRDKTQRILVETPQEKGEKEWNVPGFPQFNFQDPQSVKRVEVSLNLEATEMWSMCPGSRPIFTYGNGVSVTKPVVKEILVEGVNGHSMYLSQSEPIITPWIVKTRLWEPALTKYINENLRRNQTFVDVGANVGYFALMASRLVGPDGKVYAFEPGKEAYRLLVKNIELNKCTNVIPIQKAISSQTGKVKLFGYGNDGDIGRQGLTKVEDRDEAWLARNPAKRESSWSFVDATRLADALPEGTVPDFIKVDVEGGEKDALEGMRDILLQGKSALILEDESEDLRDWIGKEFGLALDVNVKEVTTALQHFIYKKDIVPFWDLSKWVPHYRNQYWPLFNTLRHKPCRNILEIGVNNGNNAVAMIKAAAQKVPEEEIHYWGFDLFEGKTESLVMEEFQNPLIVKVDEVKAHIKKHTTAKVTLFKGNSRWTLKRAIKSLPIMDLIYIDGGHSIETTRNDWEYSSRLVDNNTVVYFDDYDDEMPFLGSYFIVSELSSKYQAEVLPNTNYYKRPFGRLKCQLLRVIMKKPATTLKTEHFRFHLMSLPHSSTVKNWGPCAFTQLTYRFSQMMHDMGHEVFHYGTEGAEVACAEHIDVLTKKVQKQAYGDWSPWTQLWIHNGQDLAYTTFRGNAIEELKRRKEPGDILLISNGNWLREISDVAGGGIATVEPYVGYIGCFAKHKVFPSYAWMHHLSGITFGLKEGRKAPGVPKENFVTGNWSDVVIQHFFDPADHTFESKKDDYFLYAGRLIQRKGINVAVDMCQRLGVKLVICGQPIYPSPEEKYNWSLRSVGILDENNQMKPNIEYLGTLNAKELDKVKCKAKAVIVPSQYMEPFGLIIPEALLSGTPVITTDWGSFPEIVPQGEVGYRCRTMDDFIWAANNIDKIDPAYCREYAVKNFSMERIGLAYQEYFTKIHDLYVGGKGWYAEHPDRDNLNWLRRY